MEMPRPSEFHRRMEPFAGTWEGDETLHPAPFRPAASRARGRFVSRLAADGFFLVTDYEERREGAVVYSGHCVWGHDPKAATHLVWWFDSMGGSYREAPAATLDGGRLRYELTTPFGRSRFEYALVGRDEMTFRIDVSTDGTAWTPFLEGRYRRVA